MVINEFSDNNDRPPSTTDGLGRDPDDELPRSPVSDLTQELSRLLAASIAQNQANKGRSAIPTNAELINLANLVSAAAAQLHHVAPAFKDGLSSLSYGQPRSVPRQQESAASSPLEFGHDDEQMPIPSTWRQPVPYDDDHWFRQQMGAAVLGLIAGLMIVVPAVLWLSGFFGPQRSGSTAARTSPSAIESSPSADKVVDAAPARPVDQQSESAAQYVIGSLGPQRSQPFAANPTPPSANPVSPSARLVDPNKPLIEELLAQANQRIESGDVIGAREMLAGADDGTQGAISFALAETYDPNMLAAFGIRAMVADAAKARELYHRASGLGVARAQNRLDGLR
jgi:hypothetical protein